jgi:hypothetical protein
MQKKGSPMRRLTTPLVVAAALCLLALAATSASAAVPVITGTSFSHVTTDSVILEAEINPGGKATKYHFEYGPVNCAANPCTAIPFPEEGKINGASPAGVVGVPVEGLSPGATYHFRAVAKNADGPPIESPDRSFTIQLPPPVFGPCPNDAFRVNQPSAVLPDCRAYEQASPLDKNGQDARGIGEMVRVSVNGDAVTFATTSGLPGGEGGQDLPTYLASRGAGGWSTQGLLPPESSGSAAGVLGWTPDFSQIFSEVSRFGEPKTTTTVLSRSSVDGSIATIAPYAPKLQPNFAGASSGGSQVLFESEAKLPAVAAAIEGKSNLYLWDRAADTLSLAGILNDGEAPSAGAFAGAYDWVQGTTPSTLNEGGAAKDYYTQDNHAISPDATSVYFTAAGSGKLYVRRNPTQPQSAVVLNANEKEECTEAAKACTLEVSASQKTNGTGPKNHDAAGARPAAFVAATPDGSKAFFTSSEKLTNDATTGPEPAAPAIARANVTDGEGGDLSFLPTHASGIAVDGEHIYWTNPGEGNEGEGTIGRADIDGNLSSVEDEFITGANNPLYVAVNAEHVYWTNAGDEKEGHGTIGRADIDGSPASVDQKFILGASNPQGIDVDAAYVYWADSGVDELARANLNGTGMKHIEINGRAVSGDIAIDATHVYYSRTNGSSGFIRRANIDGTGMENLPGADTILAGAKAQPSIALDDSHLYLANPTTSTIGHTDLDGTHPESGFITAAAHPQGLVVDASRIYWAANQGTPPNPGNDLYRYDFNKPEGAHLTDLVPDGIDTNGAEVRGVLGSSADGSYAYFIANGNLDGEGPATPGDCQGTINGEKGACNLYLSQPDPAHPGQSEILFITRLDGADSRDWRPNSRGGAGVYTPKTARVSPDGHTLLLQSQRQLSVYDNEGTPELYRYRLGDSGFDCVSCSLTGAAPSGAPSFGSHIKLSFLFPALPAPVLTRNLSASGNQVFFETTESLLPADTNGEGGCPEVGPFNGRYPSCLDVYEWEANGAGSCDSEAQNGGCVYLLSPPNSSGASFFGDASASGDDAFLFTRSQLVGQDQDELLDVYDVSVGGGLASQNEIPPVPCEGEACKGAVIAPPQAPSPATASFVGPSSPKPVRKKARKKHRHHAKKRHHRNAKKTGRASR